MDKVFVFKSFAEITEEKVEAVKIAAGDISDIEITIRFGSISKKALTDFKQFLTGQNFKVKFNKL